MATFAALTLLYVAAVSGLSSLKLLWLDELITLHIARLGSFGAIWHALARGADPNPPMTHLLVALCRRVFGEQEFALRLPAMVGYWLGVLSLFLFLRRRLPGVWAVSGALLSMTMGAFEYSYESRSYGIFYGLCMVGVLCWTEAVDPANSAPRRCAALLGMTVALAAGISTNYFAVLAFFPVAAGELTRTLLRAAESRQDGTGLGGWGSAIQRAFDLRVWSALFVAALPLVAFRHMISTSIAQFAPFAWNKVSTDQVFDSYTQMVETMLWPLLGLMGLVILVSALSGLCANCRAGLRPRWLGDMASEARTTRAAVPPHEAAAILFLMAYPILGYAVASIRGGMMSPRFVIPVCFGFAIAGVLAVFRLFRNVPGTGAVLLCFCLAWFVARESYVGYWYMEQKQSFYKVLNTLPQAEALVPAGSPIAIPDPLMALTFQHYAPPELARRVVFPVDFPAIRLYRHDDSPEENLWAGRGWLYTLSVIPLSEFQRDAGAYVMIGSDGNWMDLDLLHHRYPLERLPINTRAGAIGGFTPLNHGPPVFYRTYGDAYFREHPGPAPVPFELKKTLPTGTLTAAEGGPFQGD
jgi:4-amino-4-deoxy-L-arabinose transferase-like glycosyltransferase